MNKMGFISNTPSVSLKFKIHSNFDYKQNIYLFWIRFVGMDLEYGTLDVVIY